MSTSEVLLIAHLVGAFWMAAGAGTLTLLALATPPQDNVAARRLSARVRRLSVLYGIVPGSVIAVLFGSWLIPELDHDFGAAWVSASYVIWVVFLGVATGIVSPRARREERSLSAAAGDPPAGDPATADRATLLSVALLDVLIVVFLVLMVTRPGV